MTTTVVSLGYARDKAEWERAGWTAVHVCQPSLVGNGRMYFTKEEDDMETLLSWLFPWAWVKRLRREVKALRLALDEAEGEARILQTKLDSITSQLEGLTRRGGKR